MRVRIDEPGRNRVLPPLEALAGREACREMRGGADFEDAPAIERQRLQTEAAAQQTRVNAQAQAEAQQLLAAQAAAAMREQHAIWRDTPAQAATAMALSQLATKLQSIGHLNITPDLLGQSLTQLLRDQAAP